MSNEYPDLQLQSEFCYLPNILQLKSKVHFLHGFATAFSIKGVVKAAI